MFIIKLYKNMYFIKV